MHHKCICDRICRKTYHPHIRVGTSLLRFYFYPLCYAAVLLTFTYYAQYYAQEQELLSDYYAFYIQFCMNNSLHVAESFIETVKGIKVYHHNIIMMSVL